VAYSPTYFRCATLIKHISARICECRFLGSSHHASNTGACSFLAITCNHGSHEMQQWVSGHAMLWITKLVSSEWPSHILNQLKSSKYQEVQQLIHTTHNWSWLNSCSALMTAHNRRECSYIWWHDPECSTMLLSYTWDTYIHGSDSCKYCSIVFYCCKW